MTKVSPYLDEINILRYDLNPNVFLTSVGQNSGDMKLLTSGMLDHIYTFPQYALGPVCFVASAPKERKNRMIGHVNGFIKIIWAIRRTNYQYSRIFSSKSVSTIELYKELSLYPSAALLIVIISSTQ